MVAVGVETSQHLFPRRQKHPQLAFTLDDRDNGGDIPVQTLK
ncbi:MAG: hypothetical protein SWY16_15845 [Cyanobacteriota bacterium]|nr:hypothetical protein [Cyanobacteriota bacterium]